MADHQIRPIKKICAEELRDIDAYFDEVYAPARAPSIPSEALLSAMVQQAIVMRSTDRQLCGEVASVATEEPCSFAFRASARPAHAPLTATESERGLFSNTCRTRSINSCAVKGLIM